MQHYFAPMEGLTDSIYRRLHSRYFPGVDKYYTPFFSPTVHRSLTPREQRELPEADSIGTVVVPQMLTKNAEDFCWMAQQCADRGYTEVNLNLGCPSGTVTAKGKGAGMLRDPDALRKFFDGIFADPCTEISVKTRLGMDSKDVFPELVDLWNDYPISLLIVHPRIRADLYTGPCDMDAFSYAAEHSRAPVCYNGNLCSHEQIRTFSARFPSVGTVMIGRGLIGDPGMFTPGGTTAASLQDFYGELLEAYLVAFGGSRNAMFRLKENWRYLIRLFEDDGRYVKRLRKVTSLDEYKAITAELFRNVPLRTSLREDW